MKYKILEIHPYDAFYEDRNHIVGQVFEFTTVKMWNLPDNSDYFYFNGYFATTGEYCFHAVKLEEVEETSQ